MTSRRQLSSASRHLGEVDSSFRTSSFLRPRALDPSHSLESAGTSLARCTQHHTWDLERTLECLWFVVSVHMYFLPQHTFLEESD